MVPFDVKTLPAVPGATVCNALVPLPNNRLLAAKVAAPVPPFATDNVPVTPVVNGKPVKLVATPEAGVPNAGAVNVGLVANTTLPDPVDVVTPVPPLATGNVPVTPDAKLVVATVAATPYPWPTFQ